MEQIGKGGYGKVYRAVHKVTRIQRAVKKINKRGLDQENQKYILSEFEALKKLDHPNLVKLIEHYQDDKHIFLVQEYLSGMQLFEQMVNLETFTEEAARGIFK